MLVLYSHSDDCFRNARSALKDPENLVREGFVFGLLFVFEVFRGNVAKADLDQQKDLVAVSSNFISKRCDQQLEVPRSLPVRSAFSCKRVAYIGALVDEIVQLKNFGQTLIKLF